MTKYNLNIIAILVLAPALFTILVNILKNKLNLKIKNIRSYPLIFIIFILYYTIKSGFLDMLKEDFNGSIIGLIIFFSPTIIAFGLFLLVNKYFFPEDTKDKANSDFVKMIIIRQIFLISFIILNVIFSRLVPTYNPIYYPIMLFFLAMTIYFLIFPYLVKTIWKSQPFNNKKLKSLESLKDIKLYLISSPTANALSSGLLPNSRYVFFTDTLVDILNKKELKAVLLHEVGHIKKRHLFYNNLISCLFFAVVYIVLVSLNITVNVDRIVVISSLIYLLSIVITGFLSRKFELSADEYASHKLGKKNKKDLITALIKMDKVNKEFLSKVPKLLRTHPELDKRKTTISNSN